MSQTEVTELLHEWAAGDVHAADRLLPLVYEELRRIAARQLVHERADHTLQATAVVHEAFLRLCRAHEVSWENRRHFFAFAARLMRRVLVDHARRRRAEKRGGSGLRVSLEEGLAQTSGPTPDLLALDQALTRLADLDPRKATVVELRVFAGMTVEETADQLHLSPETIHREWRRAKAWLFNELAPLRPAAAMAS